MITVLLPTRQRIHGLLRVLNTALDTANDIKSVEFLLKFDTDDEETYNKWLDVREPYLDFTRTFSWPRGRGYLDLYKYNNVLATQANKKTTWFLVMNDDAYFDESAWDFKIIHACEYWHPTILQLDPLGLFPCINSAAYRAMGTISKANHADTYLSIVGKQANCLKDFPIKITHEAHMFDDVVRKEGQAVYGKEWEEQKLNAEGDAQRILNFKP